MVRTVAYSNVGLRMSPAQLELSKYVMDEFGFVEIMILLTLIIVFRFEQSTIATAQIPVFDGRLFTMVTMIILSGTALQAQSVVVPVD